MVGQTGSLIVDNSGDPIWFRPLSSTRLQNADLKVQTYHDSRTGTAQPVLTWWQEPSPFRRRTRTFQPAHPSRVGVTTSSTATKQQSRRTPKARTSR